jgi:Ricin-type beta-trefoil lectin domain-like/Abnormal spindle-like microcephaly-assoc'd, ASPM-SPD-2-Hydin
MARGGTFFIKHNHAGHFSYLTLDVPGGSLLDNVLIQQFVWNGEANQQWLVTDVGEGFCTIVSVATGKALDIPGGLSIAQLPVQQFGLHGGPNQQWRFVTLPAVNGPTVFRPEVHQILNRATGMALDVPGGSQSSGLTIQQFPPHSGWNQTWILEPAPSLQQTQRLTFAPTSVAFGSIPVGATRGRTLTVENTSGRAVRASLDPSAGVGPFEWSGFDLTLADGDQRAVTVEFTPLAPGVARTELRVVSDTPASPHVVSVAGRATGTVPVWLHAPALGGPPE